ncbi:hypothetical protein D3C81_1003950 [compost metagenome]|jgi:hypothetical protein
MDEGWSNKGSIAIGLSRLVGGYVDTEILMDTEARYDELLKVADDYRCRGIIDRSERNTLIEIATAAYARSVADLSA